MKDEDPVGGFSRHEPVIPPYCPTALLPNCPTAFRLPGTGLAPKTGCRTPRSEGGVPARTSAQPYRRTAVLSYESEGYVPRGRHSGGRDRGGVSGPISQGLDGS
jgi:hypothetical protein